ncbi:hypothetical protein [Acinetobacter sp. BSP-53]|uniref:hypothetical protein n=1 Tax=Acinetobacter sp. BSP-53 TaxID=3344662 RepID=UPI0037701CEA
MDLTLFNYSILNKFDRQLEGNLEQLVKKASQIEDELSSFELKGMLCEALGLQVLDSHSSQMADQGEEIKVSFAYILKCLSLYPLKEDIYKNWNKHVELFDQAELASFSEESITELHRFIQSIVVTGQDHAYLSQEKMSQPVHLIMLLLIHLDTLITLDSKFAPLCFNQLFKFRYKKQKPYGPSSSFSDLLLYLVASHANKKPLEKVPSMSSFDQYLDTEFLGEEFETSDDVENPRIAKIRQLIKKMRAEDRFCYLTDIDQFVTVPCEIAKLFSDEKYETVAKSNARFLLYRTITDADYVAFNDMNALWLIYYFQFLIYDAQQMNPPEVLQGLSTTREFMDLWQMFYVPSGKKATFQWPAKFNEVAQIT